MDQHNILVIKEKGEKVFNPILTNSPDDLRFHFAGDLLDSIKILRTSPIKVILIDQSLFDDIDKVTHIVKENIQNCTPKIIVLDLVGSDNVTSYQKSKQIYWYLDNLRDTDQLIRLFNNAIESYDDYSERVSLKKIVQAFHDQKKILHKTIASETPTSPIFDYITKDEEGIMNNPFSTNLFFDANERTQEYKTLFRDITDSNLLEKERIIQQERTALALEASKSAVWDWNHKKKVLIWDNQMFKIFGIEKKDFNQSYQDWADRLHPDDAPDTLARFQTAIDGEGAFNTIFRIIRPNGQVRFIRAIATVFRDIEGRPERIIGINRDITDQRKAEENETIQKNRIALAVKASKLGVWDWDPSKEEMICDERMFEIYGFNHDSFTINHKAWGEALHPEDREKVTLDFQQAMECNSEFNTQFRIIRPDGQIRFIHGIASFFKDKKGNTRRVVGVNRDITKQMQVEEKEKLQKERLSLALAASKSGIWDWDPIQNLLVWDDQMFKIFGTKKDCFRGAYEDWADRLHPEDKDAAEAKFEEAMREKDEVDTQFRIIRPDGQIRFIRAIATVFRDQDGNLERIVGVNQDITDQKKAEETDLIQKNRIALAVKASKLGVWDWDIRNDVLIWDKQMYVLYGVKEEEFSGAYDAWASGLHPDDREAGERAVKEALDGTRELDIEFRVIWPDQSIRYIHGVASVIRDPQGKPIRLIGVNRDITKLKLSEEKEKIQKERLSLALESSQAGVWDWDLQKEELTWDDKLYEINALSREEYPNPFKALYTRIHPDDQVRGKAKILAALQGEENFDLHFRIIWPDQSIRYLHSVANVFRDENGNPIRMIGVTWDKTESEKAQQKLIENAILFENAEELAKLGVWQWDIIQNNVNWSKGLYDIYGINPETFKASFEGYLKRVHTDDREMVKNIIRTGLETKQPVMFEECIVRPTGEERILKSWGAVLTNKQNQAIKMIGVCLDVTEMKKAENEILQMKKDLELKVEERTKELKIACNDLKNAEAEIRNSLKKEKELGELKSRFVSTASHQFRTPLTVIKSNVELLEMYSDNIEDKFYSKFQRSFKRISKEVNRMTDLMDDVLILGRINASGIKPKFQMVDLVKTCQDVINELEEIKSVHPKTIFHINNQPRRINLDEKLFIHALMNLLHNAQKYSPGQESVDLYLSFEPDHLDLKIKDHGIGISEKDLKNIFQPFYRGENTEGIQGTGLGMSIAKEYIELNNGVIKIKSELGVGTEVCISIPDDK